MKTITFACLFVVCSTATAYAEHRHRHSYRSSNGSYIQHRHRDIVYYPDRLVVSPDTSVVASSWPYVQTTVKYPYATGSTVLDLNRYTWAYDRNMTCSWPMLDVLRLVAVVH